MNKQKTRMTTSISSEAQKNHILTNRQLIIKQMFSGLKKEKKKNKEKKGHMLNG